MKYLIFTASLIAVFFWLQNKDESDKPATVITSARVNASAASESKKHWLARFYPEAGTAQAAETPAAESMAEARINGESRTPPIIRQAQNIAATSAELTDHAAYQQYEARQNMQELMAFSKAVPAQVAQLQEDIRKGKALGIAPELIAQQERKVAELQAMRQQLLTAHPEINTGQ
ncbi:hypothetical protein [Iodobacter fluviatilis]|uniref:Uncharacterized protein n=1 Tax=Iodobacter fluviatilis TaxID=537 RepID=A0A377Q7Y6_9NEIS|nr:hypothetical protein [Iodobacter fluviatilis]TCU89485.1 hypothetical protein EV682_102397 [Iodobacter fluviatilis]STQ90855.1 Uncharacterised protein [Iodobacter fluviatilis]